MNRRGGTWLGAGIVLALLFGCPSREPRPGPPPEPPAPEPPATAQEALRPVADRLLREFVDDAGMDGLRQALERNRNWLAGQSDDRKLVFGERTVTVGELSAALDEFDGWLEAGLTGQELARRLESVFEPMINVADGEGEMLVTGYYEPVIEGSRRRSADYPVPIYRPPDDLFRIELGDFDDEWKGRRLTGLLRGNRLLPYPDRRAIRTSGRLRGRELGWARDPVDLFFVEIQGSGAVALNEGGEMRIGYAGSNGRQYRSIGRLLIDEGEIPRERMSMQALRRYLADNPDEVERILDHNQSQVFFRELDGPPVGSLGVPVTAGRSIAADQTLLPPGALGFLLSEVPGTDDAGETIAVAPLRRFVLVQDSGGAIRGADRADLFWGRGEEAALRAGLMKQPGRLYFLVPRTEPSVLDAP